VRALRRAFHSPAPPDHAAAAAPNPQSLLPMEPWLEAEGEEEEGGQGLDRAFTVLSDGPPARAAGAPPPPPLAPEEIPGVREAGWDAAAAAAAAPRFRLAFGGAMREATPANLSAFMKDFVARLLAHEYSWPFRAPVSAEEVPDYPRVILNPVDLATMAARLEAGGHYTTLGQFAADLDRMWLNAKTFNTPDTEYWRMAHRCQGVAAQWLNAGVHEDAAAGGA
jgi:hypothetical protein